MTVYFEHRLPTDTIVIRQDNEVSKFIEENAGIYYPLVKINNTVIPFGDIVSLSLRIGEQFLPQLSITIDDNNYHFREIDFADKLMYCTIFIGNPREQVYKPIKNTYLVTEVSAEPGSPLVSFECELSVPLLYSEYHSGLTMTSFNALKQIAKDVGLGFVSNVKSTNDNMTWISTSNRIDMIHSIVNKMYKDDQSAFIIFIDQYANLNVIDIRSSYESTSTITQETNILTGQKLQNPYKLRLTNNALDRKDAILIIAYTPINYYGELSKSRVQKLKYQQLNSTYSDNSDISKVDGFEQIADASTKVGIQNINTHQKYAISEYINTHNKYLLQGMKINMILDYFAPSAFLYMTVPVDIYSTPTRTYKDESNENDTLSDISNNTSVAPSNSHTRNDSLSGNAIITSIGYEFRRSFGQSDMNNIRINQTMKVFIKK